MLISIIIPTLNEADRIERLIDHLRSDPSFPLVKEIIVVDGDSRDSTADLAGKAGARVLICLQRNRAIQMNAGAEQASGEILYFLHADTVPPSGYAGKIQDSVSHGYQAGCFRLRFDWDHWLLYSSSWFTRFNTRFFRFGDQSLYVNKKEFSAIKGFNEDLAVFEDHEIVARLKQVASFEVLRDYVITSARKYRSNGPYRLQLIYFWIYLLYALGYSQKTLLKVYRNMILNPIGSN